MIRHYVTTTHVRIALNSLSVKAGWTCASFFSGHVFSAMQLNQTFNVTSGLCLSVKKAARMLLAGL